MDNNQNQQIPVQDIPLSEAPTQEEQATTVLTSDLRTQDMPQAPQGFTKQETPGMAPQGMQFNNGPAPMGGMPQPGMAPQGMAPMGGMPQQAPQGAQPMGMAPMGGMMQPGNGPAPMGGMPQPGMASQGMAPMGGMPQDGGFAPQQPFGGPVPGGNEPPKKKKKTGLIIGICAGAALLIAAALCIFVFDIFHLFGGNQKSAEAVCDKFLNCLVKADVDGLLECVPEEVRENLDVMDLDLQESKDELEAGLEMLKAFGVEFKDIKKVSSEKMDAKELEDSLKARGVSLNIKEAEKVTMSVTMSMSFMGETSEEAQEMTFICAKIGSKWYIVDSEGDEVEDIEDIEDGWDGDSEDWDWDDDTEDTTEEVTEEVTEEIIDRETTEAMSTENQSIGVGTDSVLSGDIAGLSSDLSSLQMAIDGVVYTLPLEAGQLPAGWVFDDEITEGEETLDPGEESFVYYCDNEAYGDNVAIAVSYLNTSDVETPLQQCAVNYLFVDMEYEEENVPDVVLPGGITWNMTKDDIIAIAGEPDVNDDPAYMDYEFDSSTVHFWFDDSGLMKAAYVEYDMPY